MRQYGVTQSDCASLNQGNPIDLRVGDVWVSILAQGTGWVCFSAEDSLSYLPHTWGKTKAAAIARFQQQIKKARLLEELRNRTCAFCGDRLQTKVLFDNSLESTAAFAKRKFCSKQCENRFKANDFETPEEIADKQLPQTCPGCLQNLLKKDFAVTGKSRKGVRRAKLCKTCTAEAQRSKRLRKCFSLSQEEYDTLFEFQDRLCYVCRRPPKKFRLAVDHNHKTGLVRGLLCPLCNRMIGVFKDDDERFERVAEYLRNPPATIALRGEKFGIIGKVSGRKKKAPQSVSVF